MKQFNISSVSLRCLVAVACLFAVTTTSFATSSSYYAKLTAHVSSVSPSGSGTVYASSSDSDAGGTYGTESSSESVKASSKGGSVTIYSFAKANPGYRFIGWNSLNDNADPSLGSNLKLTGTYAASTTDDGTDEHNVYAIFGYGSYTVIYDLDGGSPAVPSQSGTYTESPVTLHDGSGLSKTGTLTFANADASCTPVTVPMTIQKWVYNSTDYALGQTVDLKVDSGSEVTMKASWLSGPITLPSPTMTLGGVSVPFLGWYDAIDGGNKVGDAGGTVQITGDTTLYAHWGVYDLTINLTSSNYRTGDSVIFTLQHTTNSALKYTIPITLSSSASARVSVISGTYSLTVNNWSWNYTVTPSGSYTSMTISANTTCSFTATKKSDTANEERKSTSWHLN